MKKCSFFLYWGINSFVSVIPIIVAVAFFTLAERKLMAYLQRRVGPNIVGPLGLLQPIADALKLLFKESLFVKTSTPYLYTSASTLPFMFGFLNWFNIPSNERGELSNNSFINLLYVFFISLGSVAGVVLAGWASGSKYSTLGSYRGLSQLISYDIPMILSIIPILFFSGSLDIIDIILNQLNNVWFLFGSFISFIIFGITVLAETNRVPFDLPEAEAELVAGFNVEYSSINFALFFLGEYSSMLLLSAVSIFLFFAGTSVTNGYLLLISLGIPLLTERLWEEFTEMLTGLTKIFQTMLTEHLYFKFETNENKAQLIDTTIISLCTVIYLTLYCFFAHNILQYFHDIAFGYILYFLMYFSFTYKIVFLALIFIIVRANVPRYRFDQLLSISWKNLLPNSLGSFVCIFFIFVLFNGFIVIF